MKEVFPLNTPSNYNIKNRLTFHLRPVDSVYDITESISGLAPKTWELVYNDIKALYALPEFKNAINLCKPVRCL